MDTVNGKKLGHYTIIEELGRGGQGQVFLAEDSRLRRKVALKVLPPVLDPIYVERLQREATIASRLDHSGICSVYEAGEHEGTHYIAMRYIEGESLAQRLERLKKAAGPTTSVKSTGPAGRQEIASTLLLIENAARALHAAHETDLVHRDIKPGNIMITKDGEPVILDFGLARQDGADLAELTRTGELMGTPAYMSPEQLMAKRIRLDRRTDVYSLGATLYECLTLHRPFEAVTLEALYQQILTSNPPDPRRHNSHLSKDVKVILETALEKDRNRRYQTALDFAEDLRRVRELKPIRARPIGPILRFRRWTQRNPVLAGSIVTVMALLAIGLAVSLVLLDRVRESLQRTRAVGLASASAEVAKTDPMLSLLLARRAVETEALPATISALHEAVATPKERVIVEAHIASMYPTAISPSGDRFVTVCKDNAARIWDLEGREIAVLRHEAEVFSVEFSPRGDRIATTSADRTARIWGPEGNSVAVCKGHEDTVTRAVFSPSGDHLLTGSKDRTGRLWSVDGNCVAVLRGSGAWIVDVAFSPDGTWLLTVASTFVGGEPGKDLDRATRIWDRRGREVACLGHGERIRSAGFMPDGQRIFTATEDGTVELWTLTGERLTSFPTRDELLFAETTPGGDRLLTAHWNSSYRMWSPRGEAARSLRRSQGRSLRCRFRFVGKELCDRFGGSDRTHRR